MDKRKTPRAEATGEDVLSPEARRLFDAATSYLYAGWDFICPEIQPDPDDEYYEPLEAEHDAWKAALLGLVVPSMVRGCIEALVACGNMRSNVVLLTNTNPETLTPSEVRELNRARDEARSYYGILRCRAESILLSLSISGPQREIVKAMVIDGTIH